MASAEIIRERPALAIPEIVFDAYGNCLWVLFEDDDYRQWCDIFGAGDLQYEGKVTSLRDDEFMVLVAGRIYRVAAHRRVLMFASQERMLTDSVYDPKRDLIVGCDGTHLYCYDGKGLRWRSNRMSRFKISLDRLDEDCLYGTVNDLSDQVRSFTLWLDARYVESDIDPFIFPL
jgi:hypothetical protein